jgi:hypothetical protein
MFPQPKKYGRYILLAVFALFAFKNPTAAAHLVHTAGGLLSQGADALSKFAGAM